MMVFYQTEWAGWRKGDPNRMGKGDQKKERKVCYTKAKPILVQSTGRKYVRDENLGVIRDFTCKELLMVAKPPPSA